MIDRFECRGKAFQAIVYLRCSYRIKSITWIHLSDYRTHLFL